MNNISASKTNVRRLTACAMLSAVAFVLQFLEFSIPVIPSFIKLDVSDIPALLGSFIIGPWCGVAVQFIKNIIHLPFGTSAGVGELCNFLLGSAFALTAGFIYKFRHTRKGAVIASLSGALMMSLVSLPLNYFFVYPAYVVVYKMPLEAIIGMYEAILSPISEIPTDNSLLNCLIIFNLPFTFFKGLLESAICYIIYKPISRLYHK